jgi:phage terminase large subunit
MAYPFPFDFRNPDYVAVYEYRLDRLRRIREQQALDPSTLPRLYEFYADNPIELIEDWGTTTDPRNVRRGLPVLMPFILFPRQREFLEYVLRKWLAGEDGLCDKSRDVGISWLAVSLACTLANYHEGLVIGFGSRKEEYVDKKDGPKSLFWKGRQFMKGLPSEFRRGWDEAKHAPFMKLVFPATGSYLAGEAGDSIGRGDRASIYFVDEAAHLERPENADAALAATTDCRIDMSSVAGTANPFAEKRFSGFIEPFTFHWRDDPRKDEAWYALQLERFSAVVVAQEIDINYSASVEGIVIPSAWVQAAIDAHLKLGLKPSGVRKGGLDVADEGVDLNAFCGAHGVVVEYVDAWSGKGDDIFGTTERAFRICDEQGYTEFDYDADGLGSGVRGDARVLNEKRETKIKVTPYRGSGAVVDPTKPIPSATPDATRDPLERTNEDFFANAKAQAWWNVRLRFLATYRAVVEDMPYDPDAIISISSRIPLCQKLVAELSQPTYSTNGAGKILINKAPDGTKSPNLADSVVIRFAPSARVARGFFDF